MSGPSLQPVSELLARWEAGHQEALHALVPLIYAELHRLAHHYLQNERRGHTLQSTALVHEAFLRLVNQGHHHIANRRHFFAISARLMRQVLVQHARGRDAVKRDGGLKLTLDDAVLPARKRSVDLIALDDALSELARLDPQLSEIVELRFFGGLSISETARALHLSSATVKRYWAIARAWLHDEMNSTASQ